MANDYTTFLLTQADDSGVLEQDLPPDELVARCERLLGKYQEFADARSASASGDTGDMQLRTFTPVARNLCETLTQRTWFFDEILVADPLAPLVDLDRCFPPPVFPPDFTVGGNINVWRRRQRANVLRELMRALRVAKAPLQSDFVTVVRGREAAPGLLGSFAETVLRDASMREAFENDNAIELCTMPVGDSFWSFARGTGAARQCTLMHRYESVPAGATVPMLMPTERDWIPYVPEHVNDEEADLVRNVQDTLVLDEVKDVLALGATAVSHSAALCTTRPHAHTAVVEAFGGGPGEASERGFQLTLPYMSGAEPEWLMEQRAKESQAFVALREHLVELLKQNEPDVAARRLRSDVREVQVVMDAAAAEARRRWAGAGVAVLAGELLSYLAGLPVPPGTLGAGLAAMAHWAKSSGDAERARLSPAFFLWKAGGRRRK